MNDITSSARMLIMEILRCLHAAGELPDATWRDLVDLAKIGGFVQVVIDRERLSGLAAELGQMDKQERLALVRKTETPAL